MVRAGGKPGGSSSPRTTCSATSWSATPIRFLQEAGGTLLGSVAYPYPGSGDFSAYLLQAQASGADVLAIVGNGADLVNCVKQAHEFGLNRTMRLVAPIVTINNIQEIGPAQSQGIFLTETFYWDLNDRTRAFTARVRPTMPNQHPPNMLQAGCYSATAHFLKTVAAMDRSATCRDGAAVVAAMKQKPDRRRRVRPRLRARGRPHPVPGLPVRGESRPPTPRTPWACYKAWPRPRPASEAWPPLGRGCALVHA